MVHAELPPLRRLTRRPLLLPLLLAAAALVALWLSVQPTAPPFGGCPPVPGSRRLGSMRGAPGWPTKGDTVHVMFTSNGRPYVNYQTLALYGTFRTAQRMPGGHKMVAITRILHRSSDDDLSALIPTFRAQPQHPECDVPRGCAYPAVDRPDAVLQFFQAAREQPPMIKAPWIYMCETDYLFVRPVSAPGPAESDAVSLGYRFDYISPAAQGLQPLMRRLYPAGMGPLTDIPRTGPAPVVARVEEWARLTPRWATIWQQMQEDPEAEKRMGFVREMYPFAIACAVERVKLQVEAAPNSTLIIQPPVNLSLGKAHAIHYTWGPKLLDLENGTELWRFEKRDHNTQSDVDNLAPQPLPPPWEPGRYKTPVGKRGGPTTKEAYDLILLEVTTFNKGVYEVGGADWKNALAQAAAARESALRGSGG